MRLGLIRIYPLWLYCVWVNTRAYIQLVPYDHKRYVRIIGCRLKRVLPLDQTIVGVPSRYIVHEHAAVRSPVERDAQRLESFLPRRVPQLEGDLSFAICESRPLLHEISTNGGLLWLANLFVAVAVEKGCLTHARLTYQDNLQVGTCRLTLSTCTCHLVKNYWSFFVIFSRENFLTVFLS